MRVLVTSVKDIASQTIKRILIEDYGFTPSDEEFEASQIYELGEDLKLITAQNDMINCGHLEGAFDPEVFIFCSRHRSESKKPALLVHSTGNYTADASFGGNPQELSVSAPTLVSTALKTLYRERNQRTLDEFDVSLEVTHHGPTSMKTPLVFIELGSSEEYWRHHEGACAVASAIMDCVDVPLTGEGAIGFGGTHYASKFNKLVLERGYNMGHMAPKYAVNKLTPDLIRQMKDRSASTITKAILDWKGTNSENKKHLLPLLEEAGLEVVRDKDA
jgi:D-aminoacyl-tRNA deacylase